MRRGRDRADPQVQSATSAPSNLQDDQEGRLRRYLITMGIRTLCFVLAVVTTGWLRWTFVAFAVILPYVAVVAVNAVSPRFGTQSSPVTPTGDGPRSIGR